MIRAGIIAMLFLSCTQKTKVPENILPPYKMEKLFLDILKADEFFNQKQADSATRDSFNRFNLYQSVFRLHKTNKEIFQKSFIYYENHPDLLKIVLDSIYSEASKRPEEKKTPKIDSVKKLNLKSRIIQRNKRTLPR